MKRIVLSFLLMHLLSLPAHAGSDKIDPSKYICAEYLATVSIEHAPPLFEGLQIDGYTAAMDNVTVADSRVLPSLMLEVYALCQSQPEVPVYPLWQKIRNRLPVAEDGVWRADKTTCKNYNDNPNDGSGFVIWLDGYLRGKNKNEASVLNSDVDLNAFFEQCRKEPARLMQDVMHECAR